MAMIPAVQGPCWVQEPPGMGATVFPQHPSPDVSVGAEGVAASASGSLSAPQLPCVTARNAVHWLL